MSVLFTGASRVQEWFENFDTAQSVATALLYLLRWPQHLSEQTDNNSCRTDAAEAALAVLDLCWEACTSFSFKSLSLSVCAYVHLGAPFNHCFSHCRNIYDSRRQPVAAAGSAEMVGCFPYGFAVPAAVAAGLARRPQRAQQRSVDRRTRTAAAAATTASQHQPRCPPSRSADAQLQQRQQSASVVLDMLGGVVCNGAAQMAPAGCYIRRSHLTNCFRVVRLLFVCAFFVCLFVYGCVCVSVTQTASISARWRRCPRRRTKFLVGASSSMDV